MSSQTFVGLTLLEALNSEYFHQVRFQQWTGFAQPRASFLLVHRRAPEVEWINLRLGEKHPPRGEEDVNSKSSMIQ